jgi:hypothetical protein
LLIKSPYDHLKPTLDYSITTIKLYYHCIQHKVHHSLLTGPAPTQHHFRFVMFKLNNSFTLLRTKAVRVSNSHHYALAKIAAIGMHYTLPFENFSTVVIKLCAMASTVKRCSNVALA